MHAAADHDLHCFTLQQEFIVSMKYINKLEMDLHRMIHWDSIFAANVIIVVKQP